MALTGLQIQKLLPKTNCKECGSNTCMAFAMKLAAKKADLSLCPYASDEAKKVLGAAAEPPVRCVEIGTQCTHTHKLGEETVLYRHEKTFVHQPLIAVNIRDSLSIEELDICLNEICSYSLERVGETLCIDMIALTCESENSDVFARCAAHVSEKAQRPLVLRAKNTACLAAGARAISGTGAVLSAVTPDTVDELISLVDETNHTLAVTAPTLDELVALTTQLREKNIHNLLLQFSSHSLAEQFQINSIARRAAIHDGFKPLGYPFLRFVDNGDELFATASAITEVEKYGGIIVLPQFDPAQCACLLTLRQNIYTDPQKPIQVEPGIYTIGEPNTASPVFVTTNFSLTYFIVSGEIENAGTSAWLVVPECEGMSVLTAWAAGKFSGTSIAEFIKSTDLEQKTATRSIVIPGFVSQISGELEEGLPGWQVMVGPQEAADLESFISSRLKEG